MRTCAICGKIKPPDSFGFSTQKGKKYRMRRCKDCVNAYQRARYDPNTERRYRANRYAADPNYKVKQHLSHNYGITLNDYEQLAQRQGYRCAICNTADPGNRQSAPRFHIDHCHITGKIRGLLCHNCNAGLGRFKDEADRLEAAAQYLRTANTGVKARFTYVWGRKGIVITHRTSSD